MIRLALVAMLAAACAAEDWSRVLADCGKRFDRDEAPVADWRRYAQAALETGDLRLASQLVEGGIVRFPQDDGLRLLELHLLARAGRAEPLAAAADDRLRHAAGDLDAWRLRAWAAARLGDRAGACAALEAALLLAPDDRGLRRQLAEQQVEAGLPRAALAHFRTLMPDPALALRAAACAGAAGAPGLGRDWLKGVDGREARILEARLAVQAGDAAAARAAIQVLMEAGEADPRVLVWAGHLAEEAGELPTAEAFYARAGEAGVLRRAWICHRTGRDDEALRLLDDRDDAAARTLRQALGR